MQSPGQLSVHEACMLRCCEHVMLETQVERELMQQEYPGDDAHVIEMGNLGRQVSALWSHVPFDMIPCKTGPVSADLTIGALKSFAGNAKCPMLSPDILTFSYDLSFWICGTAYNMCCGP